MFRSLTSPLNCPSSQIKDDPATMHELRFRSNVDLKDKWRQMGREDEEQDRWARGVVEGPRVVGGGIIVIRKEGRPEGFRKVLGNTSIAGDPPAKPAAEEKKGKGKKGKKGKKAKAAEEEEVRSRDSAT